ncbi:MAG: hypothetical protein RMY28_001305 [Nostoc sp. ChiSLP01]|nr:hypothetical protein [Nostoc sp. CmiSLP01]MDZ8282402.1 hypothetical protein [Nostoc sp. ChiSLP01]
MIVSADRGFPPSKIPLDRIFISDQSEVIPKNTLKISRRSPGTLRSCNYRGFESDRIEHHISI